MADIWIDEALLENWDLPSVCLECGRDTPDRVEKRFARTTPWAFLAFFFCAPVAIIVLHAANQQRNLLAPLCEEHANHWRKRSIRSWVLTAALLVILGVLFAVASEEKPAHPLTMAGIVLTIVGWATAICFIQIGSIRATEFSPTSIRLTNVSPAFVDAYERLREYANHRPLGLQRIDLRLDPRRNEPDGRVKSNDQGHSPESDGRFRSE